MPIQMTPEQLHEIRAAYIQTKTCNALAIVFAVCGFLIFASVYERRIAPDLMAALSDISTIGIIIMAFLPAILLSRLAVKYEKRYLALLSQE